RFRTVKKTRKIFSIGNAIVCVDHVEGLGNFIEIEVGNLAEKEKIFQIAESLGYSREESIRASYLELILEKLNREV
ncbi:MAG: class IV adenylate cyclase, partial [Archaeoglobaceae archaeon]